MSEKTYFVMEIVGSSTKSIEDAIHGAIADAQKKVEHVRWFEVLETRGHVENNKVAHFQVKVAIGYLNE